MAVTSANFKPEFKPDSSSGITLYLNAAQVRRRYGGASDMALWRWLHDEKLGFPQPFRINGRRFWREADLAAWEQSRARQWR
jgi:predicted DNA-binding transcriptional regulator AlpA